MENDKQIAFTEFSFQPFSGKFVKIIEYQKPILWYDPHFVFVLYLILPMTKAVIVTAITT